MSIHPEKPHEKKDTPAAKDKYVRSMISFLVSEKANYYRRGDRVYVDTIPLKGTKLLALDSGDFRSFVLTQ